MPRLQRHSEQPQFVVLCNWIKTTASTHAGRSTSPDQPGLEKLQLWTTNSGGDTAERQPVMDGCGPAELPPRAGSTQDFSGANEHLV